jgi:hypothetical protein
MSKLKITDSTTDNGIKSFPPIPFVVKTKDDDIYMIVKDESSLYWYLNLETGFMDGGGYDSLDEMFSDVGNKDDKIVNSEISIY